MKIIFVRLGSVIMLD